MARRSSDLLSREEILSGLPARRQQNLLFVIEAVTGRIIAESRLPAELVTEKAAVEVEDAFLEAFRYGTGLPVVPRIQDLELSANHWAPLVPESAHARAALARAFG